MQFFHLQKSTYWCSIIYLSILYSVVALHATFQLHIRHFPILLDISTKATLSSALFFSFKKDSSWWDFSYQGKFKGKLFKARSNCRYPAALWCKILKCDCSMMVNGHRIIWASLAATERAAWAKHKILP